LDGKYAGLDAIAASVLVFCSVGRKIGDMCALVAGRLGRVAVALLLRVDGRLAESVIGASFGKVGEGVTSLLNHGFMGFIDWRCCRFRCGRV